MRCQYRNLLYDLVFVQRVCKICIHESVCLTKEEEEEPERGVGNCRSSLRLESLVLTLSINSRLTDHLATRSTGGNEIYRLAPEALVAAHRRRSLRKVYDFLILSSL